MTDSQFSYERSGAKWKENEAKLLKEVPLKVAEYENAAYIHLPGAKYEKKLQFDLIVHFYCNMIGKTHILQENLCFPYDLTQENYKSVILKKGHR